MGYQYHPYKQNLAETWNGTSWSVEPSSNPPGATSSYLSAVSCPSASFCMAVGYQYHPYEQNLAETWNGTSWSVEPSSNPPGATSSYLNSVPCSSPSSCTAVGYQYHPYEQNLAETWNGTSWSVEPVVEPARGDQQLPECGVVFRRPASAWRWATSTTPTEQNLAETWKAPTRHHPR